MSLSTSIRTSPRLPVLLKGIPVLFEDEDEEDMGEANRHVEANELLHICLGAFFKLRRPRLQVFSDMNCYYLHTPKHPETGSKPYFSADVMIVKPTRRLSRDTVSYTIGNDGPAPLATIEVMSRRTFKQIDLDVKLTLYAMLGIEEYILADPTGNLLPERLLLKRLQPDRTWTDEKDEDGGVTSKLGFRLVMDENGDLTVLDAKTGRAFVRPQDAVERIQDTEERIEELEEEVKRLRQRLDNQ